MAEKEFLTGNVLIAVPALKDPNFDHTVTYVCLHDARGAFGLVINRPLAEMRLGDVLASVGIENSHETVRNLPVYYGGPVQPQSGFVLHKPIGAWESTLTVQDDIAVTTSRDILSAIAEGKGPDKFLVLLGYAGWAPEQLEREVVEGAWLVAPASEEILFDLSPARKWRAAAEKLGVNLDMIVSLQGES